ncbi:MAG: sugar phosphate isomerase/epimerase family protein [Pseudomonadota bacterium]
MPDMPLTIGAALRLEDLPTHRDWLFGAERDVELQDFHAPEVLTSDWRPLAERARKELDGLPGRLGIHGPFWGLSLANPDPDMRAIVTQRMMTGLEICETVGADQMVIHSPYTTWDFNNLPNYPGAGASVVESVHGTLREVVARAESQGVTLVIENIQDIDPNARVELARSFGSDAVRVSIDTGHAAYAHGSTGAPPVDYYVHAAGEMLHHVHLQDADGYADRHWAIGEGVIPWPAVFRALARLSSNPRLLLELRDKAGIPTSFAYLRDLGLAR